MATRLFQQRRRLGPAAGLAVLASLDLALSASSAGNVAGYGWPVKPFDQPHPIRSTFGDPRTLFRGPPTRAVLYRGAGVFSLHTGVDIAAPDGTSVYPVDSGVVVSTAACKVIVRSAGGATFEYWHIVPAVSEGEIVTEHETVLGGIRRGYGHVHFVELHAGHPTNPLAPGHLTPYRDTTAPVVGRIEFRHPGDEDELMPELLRSVVEIDAPVSDMPRPSAPGEWSSMPTMPAVVRWRIEHARDGRVVLRERTAFDVRTSLPRRPFWTIYARGTRQNDPTFRKHRYWRQEGWFLLRLGVLDTRTLKDGIYRVVVTAGDVGGNTDRAEGIFLVYNHRLWPPETKQA